MVCFMACTLPLSHAGKDRDRSFLKALGVDTTGQRADDGGRQEVTMKMSWTARVLLIAGGILVGLVGLMLWADESEHGGWAAMEGYEEGYLADGSVEIRQVPWSNRQDEVSGTYEVRPLEGVTYEVVYVDREGATLFAGDAEAVAVWLEDQGEQLFIGTQAEASEWIDARRATDKNYLMPAILIGVGVLLLVVAIVPPIPRTDRSERLSTPHAPGV